MPVSSLHETVVVRVAGDADWRRDLLQRPVCGGATDVYSAPRRAVSLASLESDRIGEIQSAWGAPGASDFRRSITAEIVNEAPPLGWQDRWQHPVKRIRLNEAGRSPKRVVDSRSYVFDWMLFR